MSLYIAPYGAVISILIIKYKYMKTKKTFFQWKGTKKHLNTLLTIADKVRAGK